MPVHDRSIHERIDWVFEHAMRHAAQFASPEATLARDLYTAEHPTAIVALKCMDGRINLPVLTSTPMGIIQPFRNLGGCFDLGWPHLGEVLTHHVHDLIRQGRRVLMIITYHFSRGDPRRGCAGFNYDTAAALAHTREIKAQVEHVFGAGHGMVYPLICGLETDSDALVLHSNNGVVLDMTTVGDARSIPARLESLYPDMPAGMRADLLPLLTGNLRHIAELRGQDRELDIKHREWMLCVGRGFDWLHMPNLALIIGPYSPDLADPIRKAAGIIRSNMSEGRIPADGFLLLASVPYLEFGTDRARAELKSRFLCRFAAQVIAQTDADLARRMHAHTAVLAWRSRALEFLDV